MNVCLIYENENFIEQEAGNLKDTIENIVYQLQRYSDNFNMHIYNNVKLLEKYSMNDDIIGFLQCESDDILRNKILKTSIDICKIFKRKSDSVRASIINANDDLRFEVSDDIFYFIDTFKDSIDWSLMNSNNYHYCSEGIDMDVYNFMKFFSDKKKEYQSIDYTVRGRKSYEKKSILFLVDNAFLSIETIMHKFKILIENSTSCYSAAILVRYMIDCLLITLICISNIKIN